MKNIFLEIEYVGTAYFGSQIQHAPRSASGGARSCAEVTVQSKLEEALEALFRKKIRIILAGRTDRGVHARAQAANFHIETPIPLSNIKAALNSFLPPDIRIKAVRCVPDGFHARFWAKAKHYRYFVHNSRRTSVFWQERAWNVSTPLNISAMRKIAGCLTGRKDFGIFAKEVKKYKDTVRHMERIVVKKNGSFVTIDLHADGFMRAMARNLVSFLVKVGTAQISSRQALSIIRRHSAYVNKPAPAGGLYLWKVTYERN